MKFNFLMIIEISLNFAKKKSTIYNLNNVECRGSLDLANIVGTLGYVELQLQWYRQFSSNKALINLITGKRKRGNCCIFYL